jgi:benzoyl-CoA 2,3-dioxygenase component B
MLTEEAYHMQTGENGVGRVIHRTGELVKEGTDPRKVGAIPFDIIQRYVNEWATASYDLFGGEDSTNAANYFGAGLKGRYREGDGLYKDPKALDQAYPLEIAENGQLVKIEIPLRRAMNALLLEAYHADCRRIVDRWNRILKRYEVGEAIRLPSTRFHRHVGIHAGKHYDPEGNPIPAEEFERRRGTWFPSESDYDYVRSCMVPVREVGKIANWLAPPQQGINGQPFEFEYVKFH